MKRFTRNFATFTIATWATIGIGLYAYTRLGPVDPPTAPAPPHVDCFDSVDGSPIDLSHPIPGQVYHVNMICQYLRITNDVPWPSCDQPNAPPDCRYPPK